MHPSPPSQTLTSMCWLGNGKSFVCSYSDGCVARWNLAKPGNKPEKTFFPHGNEVIQRNSTISKQNNKETVPFKKTESCVILSLVGGS